MAKPHILNELVIANIAANCATGANLEAASEAANIARMTLYNWMQRGKRAIACRDEGNEIPESELIFVSLCDAITNARAVHQVKCLKLINEAAAGNAERAPVWQASAWLLERLYPKEYGRNRELPPPQEEQDQKRSQGRINLLDLPLELRVQVLDHIRARQAHQLEIKSSSGDENDREAHARETHPSADDSNASVGESQRPDPVDQMEAPPGLG